MWTVYTMFARWFVKRYIFLVVLLCTVILSAWYSLSRLLRRPWHTRHILLIYPITIFVCIFNIAKKFNSKFRANKRSVSCCCLIKYCNSNSRPFSTKRIIYWHNLLISLSSKLWTKQRTILKFLYPLQEELQEGNTLRIIMFYYNYLTF